MKPTLTFRTLCSLVALAALATSCFAGEPPVVYLHPAAVEAICKGLDRLPEWRLSAKIVRRQMGHPPAWELVPVDPDWLRESRAALRKGVTP